MPDETDYPEEYGLFINEIDVDTWNLAMAKWEKENGGKPLPITEYQISHGEATPQCEPVKDIIKAFLRAANNGVVLPGNMYVRLLEFLDGYTFGE